VEFGIIWFSPTKFVLRKIRDLNSEKNLRSLVSFLCVCFFFKQGKIGEIPLSFMLFCSANSLINVMELNLMG